MPELVRLPKKPPLRKRLAELEKVLAEYRGIEAALRDNEQRYLTILEEQTELICRTDRQGLFTFVNGAYCRFFGKRPEELLGQGFLPPMPAEDGLRLERHLAGLNQDNPMGEIEHRVQVPNGEMRWVKWVTRAVYDNYGQFVEFQSVGRDVTERKLTQEDLRQLAQALNKRVQELNCLYSLSRLMEEAGLSLDEIFQGVVNLIPSAMTWPEVCCARLAINTQDFTTENFRLTPWRLVSEIQAHGVRAGVLEILYLEERPLRDQGPFALEEIRLGDIIAERLGRVLERSQTLRELTIKDTVLESSLNAIALADLSDRISYINPSCLKLWGYSEYGQVLGRSLLEFWADPLGLTKVKEVVIGGKDWTGELVAKRPDDTVVEVYCAANLVPDVDNVPVGWMITFTDITELKLLESQLIRSERLAATGQLAASVAHEINSPLQAIVVMLATLEKKHKGDSKLMADLGVLSGAINSIKSTVKNLLDLNRPGNRLKQIIQLNSIITNTVALVQGHLKRSGLKVILDLSPKIPPIFASPQELSQVFLNLINNSIEALSGASSTKGRHITTRATSGELSIKTALRRGQIIISVADNGPGIASEDLNHIFDPFYTRKKKMGMGVGLSIAHGIIQDHEGTITVMNRVEGGAEFTITLPTRPGDGKH